MREHQIKIPPVSKGIIRPLWSVVIPTFNCAQYLKETLACVLDQDPGEDQMEIIVIDDHSTEDNPEAVVKALGKGRVQFTKQTQNVGKSQNYADGINLAKGQYIHLLHGDDTVSLGFYNKMQALLTEHHKAAVAFCRCVYINEQNEKIGETELLSKEEGVLKNFINKIAVWQIIQPPSIVIKREVYETIGAYDLRLKHIEDWEFYVRAALQFDFVYCPEAMAQYRIFPNNSSSQSIKGGKRVSAIDQVLTIIDSYLPKDIKNNIKKPRQQAVVIYTLSFIPKVVSTRDLKGFLVFSKSFFKYNRSLRLVGRWFRFIVQYKQFQ